MARKYVCDICGCEIDPDYEDDLGVGPVPTVLLQKKRDNETVSARIRLTSVIDCANERVDVKRWEICQVCAKDMLRWMIAND